MPLQLADGLVARDVVAGTATGAARRESASILAPADGTLRLMAWLKMKALLLAGMTDAFAAGIAMRELTLLETGCLCVGLLLCLVLPLMISARPPGNPTARISCLKIAWVGQSALALAGLMIVFSEAAAVSATVVGAVVCITCAFILR